MTRDQRAAQAGDICRANGHALTAVHTTWGNHGGYEDKYTVARCHTCGDDVWVSHDPPDGEEGSGGSMLGRTCEEAQAAS